MTVRGESDPCPMPVQGARPMVVRVTRARCGGTAFEYKTTRGRQYDGDESWMQNQAVRTCLKCGWISRRDVTFDVPLVIKTAEQWAVWWKKVDG